MKTPDLHQLFTDLTRRSTKILPIDQTPMRNGNAWVREKTGTYEECAVRELEIIESWR